LHHNGNPLLLLLILRTAVWLQAKVRERGLGLRPRLYAGSVCDDSMAEAACVSCGAIVNERYLPLMRLIAERLFFGAGFPFSGHPCRVARGGATEVVAMGVAAISHGRKHVHRSVISAVDSASTPALYAAASRLRHAQSSPVADDSGFRPRDTFEFLGFCSGRRQFIFDLFFFLKNVE